MIVAFVRKEGDSNPRYPYEYVSLANWWFQPLTHPSLWVRHIVVLPNALQRYVYLIVCANFSTIFFLLFLRFYRNALICSMLCMIKKRGLIRGLVSYITAATLFGRFQPAVEPTYKCAVEEYAVLGLENPVVLIGEDEQLGGNATQLGSIECSHTL